MAAGSGLFFLSTPLSDDGYAAVAGLLLNGRRAAGSDLFCVSAFSLGDCYRRADKRATRWKAPSAFQVTEDTNSDCHVTQQKCAVVGVSILLSPNGIKVVECVGLSARLAYHVDDLLNQAGSLLGPRDGKGDILTVDNPGIGSGWQQSK